MGAASLLPIGESAKTLTDAAAETSFGITTAILIVVITVIINKPRARNCARRLFHRMIRPIAASLGLRIGIMRASRGQCKGKGKGKPSIDLRMNRKEDNVGKNGS